MCCGCGLLGFVYCVVFVVVDCGGVCFMGVALVLWCSLFICLALLQGVGLICLWLFVDGGFVAC